LSSEDVNVIAKVKKAGISTIVILISGRPIILSSEFDAADAFLAAWLGMEGQGITDKLFGDFHSTGKLSHS
jgi:beta-glucosidase